LYPLTEQQNSEKPEQHVDPQSHCSLAQEQMYP
jgi:hypothetical protein